MFPKHARRGHELDLEKLKSFERYCHIMAITKIEVKNGILNMEFTPAGKEKTAIQFDSKNNKLMVDTMPNGIYILHKIVKGESIFLLRAKPHATEPDIKDRVRENQRKKNNL